MASDSEPRNFFLRPSQGPRSHISGSKKHQHSASWLRMIYCNHELMGDFMRPVTGPLVSSQIRCFEGATESFRSGGQALGPPRNSTTDDRLGHQQ